MNKEKIKKILISAIEEVENETIRYKQLYYIKEKTDNRNEFLFFIKPEITLSSPGKKTEMILEMLFTQMEKYGLELTDLRIMSAQYLRQYDIIAQHYGIINAVSTAPLKNLTDAAKDRFSDLTGKDIKDVVVFGSLEIFRYFPDFTASTLDYLWQNTKTEKLAGGTYFTKFVIDGKEIYLINGFHPRQLEHYVKPGRCIITMTLSGNLSWKDARTAFIGVTNPKDALPGSLRNMLLQNRDLFGLQSVSSSWNGFHLSAGPVEGLVELMRYTSDFSKEEPRPITDFNFGRMLNLRFNDSTIREITGNTLVDTGGKKTSVFDLTEEKDSDEAIALLEKHFTG